MNKWAETKYLEMAIGEGIIPESGSPGELFEWTTTSIEGVTKRKSVWQDGKWEPYSGGVLQSNESSGDLDEKLTDCWRMTWLLERIDVDDTGVEVVERITSTAARCDKISDSNFDLWTHVGSEISDAIERESQSDLAKRHEAIDNPVPTIEGVPRMYVGKTAQAGYWYISEDKNNIAKEWVHTKKGLLMWGDIFVPGTHCKPDDSWREMKSIETCSEVDW